MRVIVLNGVNLDMLGRRDPTLYGGLTIAELESRIYEWARELELTVQCRQTNNEGEFVKWCHDAYDNTDGIVVNPGAWSHYAWSIHDALEMLEIPIVEVHLSNVDEREEWRRMSVIADLVAARFIGKGPDGYRRPSHPEGERVNDPIDTAARAARGATARHEPRQRPLPRRLRELERRAPRRAGPRRLFTDFRYIEAARAVEGVEVVQTKRDVIGGLARHAFWPHRVRGATLTYALYEVCAAAAIELVPTAAGVVEAAARGQGRGRARDDPRARARSRTGCSSGS